MTNRLGILLGFFACATAGAIILLMKDSPAMLPGKVLMEKASSVRVDVYGRRKLAALGEDEWVEGDYGLLGHGSGVILGRRIVVTCSHVAHDGKDLVVVQGPFTSSATVVRRMEVEDLALLVTDRPLPGLFARLGDDPITGQVVTVIGYPLDMGPLVTQGIISYIDGRGVVSDAVVNPGNSGGGVFDLDGSLVGIARALYGPFPVPFFQGHSIFVPVEHVRNLVRSYEREAKRLR